MKKAIRSSFCILLFFPSILFCQVLNSTDDVILLYSTCENNLLRDGDFESNAGFTFWENEGSEIGFSSNAYSGNHAIEIGGLINSKLVQRHDAEVGHRYTLKAFVKQSEVIGYALLLFRYANNDILASHYVTTTPGNTYKQIYISEIAPPGTSSVEVVFNKQVSAAGRFLIDDVCLTASCGIDLYSPVISDCPPNLIIETDTNGATVNWDVPTASDEVNLICPEGVSLTSNYQPGDFFPIGTSEVIYTATDESGNTTKCKFDITIIELLSNSCAENLLGNPGFENADTLTIWQTDDTNEVSISNSSYSGNNALEINSPWSSVDIWQDIPATEGWEYKLTGQLLQTSEHATIRLRFWADNHFEHTVTHSTTSANGNYDEVLLSGIAPPNTAFVRVLISTFSWDESAPILLDHFCLTERDVCNPDVVAPEIYNCPEDIIMLTNNDGENVNWIPPTTWDHCSTDLLGNFTPGDYFTLGTTLVTYTSTDLAGNTAVCEFNIEIVDAPEGSVDINLMDALIQDTLEKGNFYPISIEVFNSGDATLTSAADIKLSVYLLGYGNIVGYHHINNIPMGSSFQEILVYIPLDIQSEGLYNFQIKVDADNVVSEINENNNTLTTSVFITDFTSSPCIDTFPKGDVYDCVEHLPSGDLRVITKSETDSTLFYFENIINESGTILSSDTIDGPDLASKYAIENDTLYFLDYFENKMDSIALSEDLLVQSNLQDEILYFDDGYIFLNISTDSDTLFILKTDEQLNIINSNYILDYNYKFVESPVALTTDRFAFIYNVKASSYGHSKLVLCDLNLEIVNTTYVSFNEGSYSSLPRVGLHKNSCGLWKMKRSIKNSDEGGFSEEEQRSSYISQYVFEDDDFHLKNEYESFYGSWIHPAPISGSEYGSERFKEFKGLDTEGNTLNAYRYYETYNTTWSDENNPPLYYIPAEEILYLSKTTPNGDTLWQKNLQPAIAWPFTELVQIGESFFLLYEGNYFHVDCDIPGFTNDDIAADTKSKEDDFAKKEISQGSLLLYPNPAQQYVDVNLSKFQNQHFRISVYNSLGKLILRQQVKSNQSPYRIILNDWENGCYFLSVESEDGINHMEQFIILR